MAPEVCGMTARTFTPEEAARLRQRLTPAGNLIMDMKIATGEWEILTDPAPVQAGSEGVPA